MAPRLDGRHSRFGSGAVATAARASAGDRAEYSARQCAACAAAVHPSGPTGLFRSAVIVLVSVGAFLCAGSPTRGDAIQYNSSKCSEDPDGMIYVAAGRHVYHQPFENLRYVHGVSLETTAGLPMPPRPWQPKGCPDHPLRGMGFKFGPFSDVANPEASETATGGLVQLIEIDPSSWWDTHERYSLSNSRSCAAGHLSRDRNCTWLDRVSAGRSRLSRSTRAALRSSRLVDSRHYAGPLGQPLAILCNPDMSADADDHVCEISYRLDQDVGVWYEFRTSLIPLSGLIGFDRELRRRIAEAEVSDYWWPILPTGRPQAPHQ